MTTMITVDGVMQGLGGPEEDRRGGLERGGRSGRQPIWTVLNTKPRYVVGEREGDRPGGQP